jgi:hypothetical protein
MAKEHRCEFKSQQGRCSRKGRWAWEDDSLKVHHVCSQHKKMMIPDKTCIIDALPKCCGDVRTIVCKCDKYTCNFMKNASVLNLTTLVNKGKGICTSPKA